jgi:DHA2 family methylenomycin A resistance protein-like MFS transporter
VNERSGWLAVFVLAGGLFAAVVSTTVVSVALPTIGTELHAGQTELAWIVDAYVLVYASLLAAGGALGDRYGRKGLFMSGVALFGVGALITGVAPTIGILLVGRVVQGLGPALLVPGSLTVIRATFEDPKRRAAAIGLWSTSSGLALAVGPALGGLIVDGIGWRWVVLVNVPFCALLVVLAAFCIPRVPRTPARGAFDWLGALLTTLTVVALAYAIIEGPDSSWTSWPILGAFGVGLLALILLVGWERHRPEPLMDMSLFTKPRFVGANVAALVVFLAFVGSIVYFSAYFQDVQGHPPVVAGLDVSAIGVAFAFAAAASGRLVGRIGTFWPMVVGLVVSGVATFGLLRLTPDTGIGSIWWNFAIIGAGVGLCLTPMTATAVSSVDSSRAGMASAVHNALRQFGQVLGVAVLGVLVYALLPHAGGTSSGRRLGGTQASLFVTGLHHAILVSGLALLAAAVLVSVLEVKARRATEPEQPDRALSPAGKS